MKIVTILLASALTFLSATSFSENLNCSDFSIRPIYDHGTPSDLSSYTKMRTQNGYEEVWVKKEILLDASTVADASVAKSKPLFSKEQMEAVKRKRGYTPSRYNLEEAFTTGGPPEINIKFKRPKELEKVTKENTRKRIAVVLDGELIVAASIIEPITDGAATLGGVLSVQKANKIAERIKQLSNCEQSIGLTN